MPFKVKMNPTCGCTADYHSANVYETFESKDEAASRRREILSSVLNGDDEDLTQITDDPQGGVCLKYFLPSISTALTMGPLHVAAVAEMRQRCV